MQQVAVYSTLVMTLGLVAVRPTWRGVGLSPALVGAAGVLLFALYGAIGARDVGLALVGLWRPLVTIASLMVMTDVARRIGLLTWAAGRVERRTKSARGLLIAVFALGAAVATALNNDAAILLVTPLVLALVARAYPDRPELALPLATAVFASAGVAPLLVSNPMNAIAAEMAGIEFLPYAARMIPVALVVWLLSLGALLVIYRRELAAAPAPTAAAPVQPMSPAQRRMMWLLGGVLVGYAAIGWIGGPVWAVAVAGALASLGGAGPGVWSRARVGVAAVSWETLAFLVAVIILAAGLREVGFVALVAEHYQGAGPAEVGVSSAIGSALLNNHPMAVINVMALDAAAAPTGHVFAALIGGDLGPRLLPAGSLAGLLWVELLRRQGVRVSLARFAAVGLALTVPALAASLALLSLW